MILKPNELDEGNNQKGVKMLQTELNEFKTKLLKTIEERVDSNLENRNLILDSLNELSGDEIDLTVGQKIQTMAIRLEGRDIRYLKKVYDALEKIENGSFGICKECGEEIEVKRLNARPTATMCITCKEIDERGEQLIYKDKKQSSSVFVRAS